MNTQTLVRRILAKVPAFTATNVAPPGVRTTGDVLGIYSPGLPEEMLVVTATSVMALIAGEWREIRFSDIVSVQAPSDKVEGTEIAMTLRDGTIAILTVSASRGRFRDVYEICRFLNRASAVNQ